MWQWLEPEHLQYSETWEYWTSCSDRNWRKCICKSSEIRDSNNAKCCDDRSVSIRTYIGRGCTLPATITSIGSRAFVGKPNGKRELHITIETATPPTIDGSFATHADAYVKVPDGSLGAYLPNLDLSKPFKNSGDTKWGGLRVIDNAQKLLTYHGVNSWIRCTHMW